MEMQASRMLNVTPQQAWDALNDPAVLKVCVPGCDKLELVEENKYAVGMALKIGPVSAKFSGKIALQDIKPPNSYTLKFEGQGGVAGFGKGTAQVSLLPQPTGCELAYSVQAQVGGKVAQLGQRLIDGAAKSMAEDFFKRFDEEMQRLYPAPAPALMPGAQATPAHAAGATGVQVPVWAWCIGAAVLVALVWVLK
ncbi:MAG: SRPBCC family protein [Burkholderiaceae bacterium]